MPNSPADQFECKITWLDEQPMFVGRSYQLQIGDQARKANITALKYKLDASSQQQIAATKLVSSEVAICNISLDQTVAWASGGDNAAPTEFTLLDLQAKQVVGTGLINFALRRSQNIHPHRFDIDMAARAAQKTQKPVVLWFTGLSSSGKSTIANAVERQLFAMGKHSYLLDGDNVRQGLNRDLGFTDADRVENIRRVAELARLMMDSGLIVITAFISPFVAERQQAQQTIGAEHFFEIFIDTPLALAEQRDVKGLYKKARNGQLKNFTGIDSPYEAPISPALVVKTENSSAEQSALTVIEFLQSEGVL